MINDTFYLFIDLIYLILLQVVDNVSFWHIYLFIYTLTLSVVWYKQILYSLIFPIGKKPLSVQYILPCWNWGTGSVLRSHWPWAAGSVPTGCESAAGGVDPAETGNPGAGGPGSGTMHLQGGDRKHDCDNCFPHILKNTFVD